MAQNFVEWCNNRWKAMNFAALEQSSISFFEVEKQENVLSRWKRALIRAGRVGKGSSKDNKATLLREKHWLEAIDPLHRYGENLKNYYKIWSDSYISEPFFYWLDIGEGKQLDLEDCPRTELQRQCIQYLAPKEREAYEVIIENGKLVYKQNGVFVDTIEGIKWIFVLGTSRNLFVWKKEKGLFQHSSFLAGASTLTAGRIVVANGVLQAIWAYSGHYCPNEENLKESIRFLDEQQVDLRNVKMCPVDDDIPPIRVANSDTTIDPPSDKTISNASAAIVHCHAIS